MPTIECAAVVAAEHEVIDVTDPVRRDELQRALGRALNCWERAPRWLAALYYELQTEYPHEQAQRNRRPGELPQQIG